MSEIFIVLIVSEGSKSYGNRVVAPLIFLFTFYYIFPGLDADQFTEDESVILKLPTTSLLLDCDKVVFSSYRTLIYQL